MGDKLVLFRGDFPKIKKFDIKATNNYCLYGQGVYLTSSLDVAQSYRAKGADWMDVHPIHELYKGEAANRNDALYQKAFPFFVDLVTRDQPVPRKSRHLRKEVALGKKRYEEILMEFKELVYKREIVADYVTSPLFVPTRQQTGNKYLRVCWHRDNKEAVGFVTKFCFDRRSFQSSMIRIDRPIVETCILEILFDHKIELGTPYTDREDYIKHNLGKLLVNVPRPGTRQTLLQTKKIRDAFTPYGYRGFEYRGGMYMGGLGAHQAFVVWDDEYVNQHRVCRFK